MQDAEAADGMVHLVLRHRGLQHGGYVRRVGDERHAPQRAEQAAEKQIDAVVPARMHNARALQTLNGQMKTTLPSINKTLN